MRYSVITFILSVLLLCLTNPTLAQYSGEYDVGGGNNDFGSPVGAASLISINGVSGPVICNIYSGTMWTGRLNFPHNIPGISPVNTITFRNATGHSPVLTAPYYNYNVIHMHCADYITIEGLEFTGCQSHVIFIDGSSSDSCHQIRIIGNYFHDFGTDPNANTVGIYGAYTSGCQIIGNEIDGDVFGILIQDSRTTTIANNMVYSCEWGLYNEGACIECYWCRYNLIAHNSCYNNGPPPLYLTNNTNATMYNNILYQSASGGFPAINLQYVYSSATCDYNDLYAPDANVGNFEGTSYQTLAEWQTGTSLDSHSISANPNFVSGTDLHINEPSPVGIAGIAVPEVTEDFDGDTRKIPHPDIGADEYVFPLAGSYDINGGNNDFATIDEAIDMILYIGHSDHVTFNVYSGTYNGQIDLPSIPGTSDTTTITFQAASGQNPIITNTTGTTQTDGNGFYLTGADYITIQGFEITNTAAHGIMNSFSGSDSSSNNRFIGNYIHDVGALGDYAGIYLLNSPNCEILRNEIESDYYGIQISNSSANLIANNMIYFASLSGIYDDESTGNRYYYNSVYLEMNPTTTYNMYLYHGTDIDLKNNVLYHSGGGTHYAISITGDLSTYPVTSDYNDLYAPSAYIGYYNGNQTTLANWQTATNLDSSSLSVDPDFVSLATPDLHCNPTSPLEMAGTPVPEVTNDFDGDSRNAGQPDIGADEFYGPMAGTYDVGGGAMHYATLTEAANHLNGGGMVGPVTLNTYTGSYSGFTLSSTITGLGASNSLTIQNAPGESPIIQSLFGYGIRIDNADYITIQGFEIKRCARDGIRVFGSSSDSCAHINLIGNYIHDVGEQGIGHYAGIYLNYVNNCQILGNEIDGDNEAYTGINVRSSTSNIIANNMLYECQNTEIYSSACTNDFYCYNSVLSGRNHSMYLDNANNLTVKNNILHQTRANAYALYIADSLSTSPVISDYNDLYSPDGHVGYYFGNITDLTGWQTATGLDLNSISGDPNYASTSDPFDLHLIAPSVASNVGTPLTEVTDDFDGDPRDLSTPDIGADEFGSDYWVVLSPENQYDTTVASGSVDYMLMVQNVGDLNDAYDLSVAVTGESWPHTIYDASGSTIIDHIAVNAGAEDSFMVRVNVPSTASYNQNSYGQVIAESQNGMDNMLSDTTTTNTYTIMGGTYDVGGGNLDFLYLTPVSTALQSYGIGAPCVFNIYSDLYEDQIDLPPIAGSSPTNTIIFQAAPGENPVITNPYGSTEWDGNGFYITGADYIDIIGLEITNCYYDAIQAYSATDDSSTHLSIMNNYIHDNGISIYAIGGISLFKTAHCTVAANELSGDGISNNSSTGNLIANNMVYNNAGFDITIDFSDSTWCCYNSILSTLNAGIQHYHDSPNHGNVILNNSVYMTIWGYAIYIPLSVGIPDWCDYNNLYAPNGMVGFFAGDRTTLTDWQTATGLDSNSISADPGYLSITNPFDLHITDSSPLDSTAMPIAGITTDFDGDTRHSTYPDIGADEVGVAGPPEAVDDLVITLSSSTDDSTDITLIWSPALNAQQYHIYKSTTDPGSGYSLIGSTADTTYTDNNAVVGAPTSFYYVTADNQSLDMRFIRRSAQIRQNDHILSPSVNRRTSP